MTTKLDCDNAVDRCREQRLAFAPLMKVDLSKCATQEDRDRCARMLELAEKDPVRWDAMLGKKEAADLFRRGALHFGER